MALSRVAPPALHNKAQIRINPGHLHKNSPSCTKNPIRVGLRKATYTDAALLNLAYFTSAPLKPQEVTLQPANDDTSNLPICPHCKRTMEGFINLELPDIGATVLSCRNCRFFLGIVPFLHRPLGSA